MRHPISDIFQLSYYFISLPVFFYTTTMSWTCTNIFLPLFQSCFQKVFHKVQSFCCTKLKKISYTYQLMMLLSTEDSILSKKYGKRERQMQKFIIHKWKLQDLLQYLKHTINFQQFATLNIASNCSHYGSIQLSIFKLIVAD